jgi:superfamily II DNA/RNA helicase
LDTFSRFETDDIKMLIVSERADNSMPVENVKYVVHYHLPDSTNGYLDILNKTPDSVHMSLIAPGEEEQLIEIEDMLKRPILRNILTNFDYGKQVTNPRKKKKRSKRKKTPQTKTVWDPEVPRTWGDPNAPRSIPEKIPLETWSPSPLPSIWLGEDKKRTVKDLSWSPGPLPSIWLEEDKKRTVKGMSGSKQSHRRRKKYNRKRNGNKTSRYKKQ